MIELRRILLVDWYLFRVEQIDVAGMTALIGPNGSGKSAIIDAVQTVLTGANMMSIRFNASAQSAARSKRSIRDYCLGVVSLDEKGERSEPTRQNAYTYSILGFVDTQSNEAINVGVAFSATHMRVDETCEARFLVRGRLISRDDVLEDLGNGEVETRQWHSVRMLLRTQGHEVLDSFGSASDFVSESLRALSPQGFPLDPRRFIKAFRNALLLKPVENPTEFVRNYVLDVPSIRVDRLRRSIELYRFLTSRIENLKAQAASLSQVQRVVSRINENERLIQVLEWEIARLRWEKFRRECRQLQSQLRKLKDDAAKKQDDVALADSRVSRLDADFTQVELTLNLTDGQQLALLYESDRSRAIAERENAASPVRMIEQFVARIEVLTERRTIAGRDDILHGLLSAVTLAHKPVGLSRWNTELPTDWKQLAESLDSSLGAVTDDHLSKAQNLASDRLFNAQREVNDLQERVAQIDRNLDRLDKGLSPIESGTSALLRALQEVGIGAQPLCDITDVKDPKWRFAAEAALGRSREALIVEPKHAANALEVYRKGSEEAFRFAEVVNTTKTAQTHPPLSGSLATVLTTDNRHARAFLDFRLGRLMMVESMDRVLSSESAITPDRMMQSGRTIKRLSHPGYLKLGRTTIEETRRLLQSERTELMAQIGEKAQAAKRIKEDSDAIEEIVRGFQTMRSASYTCVTLGALLAEFDKKIAGLGESVNEAKRSRDPALVSKLERLRLDREAARRQKEAAGKAWQEALGAENRVLGTYEKLVAENFSSLSLERRSKARAAAALVSVQATTFEEALARASSDGLQAEIENRRADAHRRVSERRSALQRELSASLLKHCQQFSIALPFEDQDARADVVGPWAHDERQRLETHELVKYEEQCRVASGEMVSAFRDDLLHRLHDAFEGIRETLADLNRHLKDRKFHGRDYYTFKLSGDPSHADMIELVRESRRPDFELPLFSAEGAGNPDNAIARAVRSLEQILADPDARTDEIEDPRKYFTFELYIHDEQGKIRSSLTSRAGTGSGGEGQLPFYIAIAASLAATYQNKRTGQTGLALAVFDEAFNRLDTKAICACSEFMQALGLQIVVATPDEKRHIFMEIADTVVNVNRTGNVALIDTEYLTERTRSALAAVDPYRKGFDEFKAERLAEEAKQENKQRDAAA